MARREILDRIQRYVDPFRISTGKGFRLKKFDPGDTCGLQLGKGEAADLLARNAVRRLKFTATRMAVATASATATAHTPATAESEVLPQRASARNEKSRRGSITSAIMRFTATTTTKGSAATMIEGAESL